MGMEVILKLWAIGAGEEVSCLPEEAGWVQACPECSLNARPYGGALLH